MPLIKGRAQTLVELAAEARLFLFDPHSSGYGKRAREALKGNAEILAYAANMLRKMSCSWDEKNIKTLIEIIAIDTRKEIGQVFLTLRAALFGQIAGPDISASIAVFGKEETISRIIDAFLLEQLAKVKVDKAIVATVSVSPLY
jgi:glutamyl-tRNA synthetase